MAVKETRILALDIGLIKANEQLAEHNAKYKELQAEHISQSNYILDQQTIIAKGVEESGQLQRDLKKVQDVLASVVQTCAKKDEEIMHLKSQLQKSKLVVKTQRGIIDVIESDKGKLREQILALEANMAKLETEKKHIKAQERKKATEYFQSQFQSKEGSLWIAMNAVFTAYPDLEWSKIEPFLSSGTPIASFIPALMTQYKASSGQGTDTSAPSASTNPPPSRP